MKRWRDLSPTDRQYLKQFAFVVGILYGLFFAFAVAVLWATGSAAVLLGAAGGVVLATATAGLYGLAGRLFPTNSPEGDDHA